MIPIAPIQIPTDPAQLQPRNLYPPLQPEEETSILGNVAQKALSGLGYIGSVLDKTFGARAIRGLLGGNLREGLSVLPFSDSLGITDPNQVVHGRDLLEKAGIVDKGEPGLDAGDVAGFLTDVALDPSMYLGIGPLTRAGQLMKKAGALRGVKWGEAIRGANYAEKQLQGIRPVAAGLLDAKHAVPVGSSIIPVEVAKQAEAAGIPLTARSRRVSELTGLEPVPGVNYPLNGQGQPLLSQGVATSGAFPLPATAPTGSYDEALDALQRGVLPTPGDYVGKATRQNYKTLAVDNLSGTPGQSVTGRAYDLADKAAADPATPLKGLLGIGLPFAEPSFVLGTGEGAARFADRLSGIGDWIKGTAPARYARVLFDPRVEGTTTAPAQEIAATLKRPEKQALRAEVKQGVYDIQGEMTDLLAKQPEEVKNLLLRRVEGLPIPRTASEYQADLMARNPQLYAQLQQEGRLGDLSSSLGRIDTLGGKIEAENARLLAGDQALGIPTHELGDAIGYNMRLLNPVDAGGGLMTRIGGKARQAVGGTHSSQLARKELFENFPEGTGQINNLFREMEQVPGGGPARPLLVGPDRALNDLQAEAYLRQQLSKAPGSDFRPGVPRPLTPELEAQARELAGYMKGLGPEMAGRNFFREEPVLSAGIRGLKSVEAQSGAHALYEGLPKIAVQTGQAGHDAVPVARLLEDAGLTLKDQAGNPVAHELAAKSLGIPVADLAHYEVPRDVAHDLTKWLKAWQAPEEVKPVIAAFDAATNLTKAWLTTPFPAFHTRNIVTGLFNMWRDGALSLSALRDGKNVMLGKPIEALPGMKVKRPEAVLDEVLKEFYSRDVAFGSGTSHSGDLLRTKAEQAAADLNRLPGKVNKAPEEMFDKLAQLHEGGVLQPAAAIPAGQQSLGVGDLLRDLGLNSKPQVDALKQRLGVNRLNDLRMPPEARFDVTGKSFGEAAGDYARGFTNNVDLNPLHVAGVSPGGETNTIIAQGRKLGNASEDWMRISHYIAKRRQGFSPDEAAAAVRKYHFDYGDVTPFERNVAKRIVPFYTFSSRNLPPVLQDLAERPAKLSATIRGSTAGQNDQAFVPPYISEGANVPIGGAPEGYARYIASFGLPFEDEFVKALGSVGAGQGGRAAGQLLGGMNPLLKYPIEEATGTQLWSGRKLRDLRSTGAATLLSAGNEEYARPLSQLISNTPAARAVTTLDKLLDERKDPLTTGINLLTGARITDVDLAKQQEIAARESIKGLLSEKPGVKTFEDIYVRPENLGQLSPEDYQMLRLYKNLQLRAEQRARAAKQQGIAVYGRP